MVIFLQGIQYKRVIFQTAKAWVSTKY